MSQEPSTQSGGDPNSDGSTGGGEGNPSQSHDTDFVSKAEFDKVSRANNWAQSQVKSLRDELDSLRQQLDAGKSQKDDGKPSERLVAAEKKIQELQDALGQKDAKIRDFTVKSRVLDEARKFIRADALEAFWQLEGGKFDVVEFNGEQHVGLKDQPYTKLQDYFEDHVKQNLGFLVANQRAGGTGEPSKGAIKSEGASHSMKELEGMSPRERTQIFTKEPKLRDEWVRHKGLIS